MKRPHRLIVPVLSLLLVSSGATAVTQAASSGADQLLLSHVPPAIAATCTPTNPADTSRLAQVDCQPGGSISDAQYVLFADNSSMNAAFNNELAAHPDATGQDCSTGPGQGGYTIDGVESGQLFCDQADGKTFIEWTDDRFSILAVGSSISTDYGSLYNWWADDAGPIQGNGVPQPTTALPTPNIGPTPSASPEPSGAPTPSGSQEPGNPTGPKVPSVPESQITGADINQVIFATQIDPVAQSPVGIADTFLVGTPQILVLVAWRYIEVGATLDVKLFDGDRLMGEQSVTANNPTATAPTIDLNGAFAIPFAPDGGFTAGQYSAELDYDGLPEQVASFVVNDTGDGAPLPGNGSLGPSGTSPDLGPIPYVDPSSVLVVTRSSILREHMGAQTDAVLAAAAKVGTVHDLSTDFGDNTRPLPPAATIQVVKALLKAGSYKYLLILGNDDAVPMGHVELPDSVNFSDQISGEDIPGDYAVSDDPYADLDGDPLGLPDIAVARIPTSDDAALMLTQLGEVQPQPMGAFALANEVWRSEVAGTLKVINGITPVTLYYSPPTLSGQVPQTNEGTARYVYVALHGNGSETDNWAGEVQQWTPITAGDPLGEYDHEESDFTDSMDISSAGAPGALVDVDACFGAYTLDTVYADTHKTTQNSLALKFLAAGSRAFIGDTYLSVITVSVPGGPLSARTGFDILLWQAVAAGATPIDAYFQAKTEFGQLVAQAYADTGAGGQPADPLTGDEDFLTLHEMSYLGRP